MSAWSEGVRAQPVPRRLVPVGAEGRKEKRQTSMAAAGQKTQRELREPSRVVRPKVAAEWKPERIGPVTVNATAQVARRARRRGAAVAVARRRSVQAERAQAPVRAASQAVEE